MQYNDSMMFIGLFSSNLKTQPSQLHLETPIKRTPTHQQEQFSRCGQTFRYRKLLFSLAWFHAILLERRKFKSLGFNVPYEFNESDFSICHDLVIVFLDEVRSITAQGGIDTGVYLRKQCDWVSVIQPAPCVRPSVREK